MANYYNTVDNFTYHYERYDKAWRAMCDIEADATMTICKEDKNLEELRHSAELALNAYVAALGHKCLEEKLEIVERLKKSDSVNLSNLFKRRP